MLVRNDRGLLKPALLSGYNIDRYNKLKYHEEICILYYSRPFINVDIKYSQQIVVITE